MSRIDELIAELCPDGVPFKLLGEIGVFSRGGGFKKDDLVEAGFPCIHYGEIYTTYKTSTSQTVSFLGLQKSESISKANFGALLIAISDVTPKNVGTAIAWLGQGEIAIGGDILVFTHSLDPSYVSYFFASEQFQVQKKTRVTGATVRHLSAKSLSSVKIPVPPLAVQQEIVRILDRMETLEAELEAELEARRKQYEHYRNSLLNFAEAPPRVERSVDDLG